MTTVIDGVKVLEVLREVVAENSEDTYASCHYSTSMTNGDHPEDAKPVCIAGHVVHKLGGTSALANLQEMETIDSEANTIMLRKMGLTENAIEVLRAAQTKQDSGATWGAALIRAQLEVEDAE